LIKLFGPSQILKHDETIQVIRTGSTIYRDGKPQKYDDIQFKLIGNVQPMNARDLLMVPEHDRFREQYWIYLNNRQFPVNMGLNIESITSLMLNDRILRLNVNYQVQSLEDWGSYVKARIMRIDIGPNRTP